MYSVNQHSEHLLCAKKFQSAGDESGKQEKKKSLSSWNL